MHMYVSDGLINPQLSGFGSNLTLYVNQHAEKITLWGERIILHSHKSELLRRERRIMEFFFWFLLPESLTRMATLKEVFK